MGTTTLAVRTGFALLRPLSVAAMVGSFLLLPNAAHSSEKTGIDRVVHISVDGLHYAAIEALERAGGNVEHLVRLRDEGSSTDNARTDPFIANTLPNHASQLTGRAVFGASGHGWFINDDPQTPGTLTVHELKGEYVASVFDVLHDRDFSTALFASKPKFDVFDRSWNAENGAPDRWGEDNGRDKIDIYMNTRNLDVLVDEFIADLASLKRHYSFLHLSEPDSTGHAKTWDLTTSELSEYLEAVERVDALVGRIVNAVLSTSDLADSTAIILTSDHGGILGWNEHFIARIFGLVDSGIVPFYVWNPRAGIRSGDLYDLNFWRLDPGRWLPYRLRPFPPVRNGDSANLALDLLGQPPVPGSTINAYQTLWVGH